MKLIFAQGNPSSDYAKTRHNIGWRVLDAYANRQRVTFSIKSKFSAEIAEYTAGDTKALLVKPTTFYNETGSSARALIDFYKLDPTRDILVLHDELTLPFGKLRIRHSGSDAGNNGIKSLTTHLGSDYARLRIGIWSPQRNRVDDTSFVLGAFSPAENIIIEEAIAPESLNVIDRFIDDTLADETISLDLSAFEPANNKTDK